MSAVRSPVVPEIGNSFPVSGKTFPPEQTRSVPRRLLTEAEVLALAPGDAFCDRYGVWYEITQVYPASRGSLGVLLVMVDGRRIDQPLSRRMEYIRGPLFFNGRWIYGTRRSQVRFASREMREAA